VTRQTNTLFRLFWFRFFLISRFQLSWIT
jgi:hypothetical protein